MNLRSIFHRSRLESEMRAEMQFHIDAFAADLIKQGVPEANIETQAFGNQNNLTADQVKQLLDQDTDISAEVRGKIVKSLGNIVLAYNRRVDFTLSSTGQESAQAYPFNTDDFAKLAERNGPRKPPLLETAAQREGLGN